jgi:hypothetical protein
MNDQRECGYTGQHNDQGKQEGQTCYYPGPETMVLVFHRIREYTVGDRKNPQHDKPNDRLSDLSPWFTEDI